MTVEIDLTDGLLRDLDALLRAYRIKPYRQDISTPELLAMALREEERLAQIAVAGLLRLLSSHRPPALDCDITEQMDAFAHRALDAARVEEL